MMFLNVHFKLRSIVLYQLLEVETGLQNRKMLFFNFLSAFDMRCERAFYFTVLLQSVGASESKNMLHCATN